MKKLSEEEEEISNKKPRKALSARSMLYGHFVKAATLTAGGEDPPKQVSTFESSEDEEKLDLSGARKLADEELVQICGGRTAHKGARHSLTMRTKLAQLEEQERAFLEQYSWEEERRDSAPERQQEAGASVLESSHPAEGRQKAKKTKRKRSEEQEGGAAGRGRPEPGRTSLLVE